METAKYKIAQERRRESMRSDLSSVPTTSPGNRPALGQQVQGPTVPGAAYRSSSYISRAWKSIYSSLEPAPPSEHTRWTKPQSAMIQEATDLYEQEHYGEGKLILQRLLEGMKGPLGKSSPNMLFLEHKIAVGLENEGAFDEALKKYEEVFERKQKALGPGHSSSLNTLYCLASLQRILGRLEAAYELFDRGFQLGEAHLGWRDATTLKFASALALLLVEQRRSLDQAEDLCNRIRIVVLDNPAIGGISLSQANRNLAFVYQHRRQFDKAQVLFTRALSESEAQLGYDHDETITTVCMLADLHRQRNFTSESEQLMVRA
ncbi:MAG: hypothetical protein M1833_003366 [Piccolia ochrophora]|nr:MAG: hypothetical protein M1833_003366 [Piccolia ochrophora]